MALLSKRLGVDLGTVNLLVYEGGQIVLQEPTLAAFMVEQEVIVEVGQPAREMLGKVDDEDIQIIRPVQNGAIADFDVVARILEHFFGKIAGRVRFFKPSVMMTVPYGANSVERRAVHEAAMTAGARDVTMIWEPLAAAIGAGLPVGTPAGDMVVNIGGGVTEAAVLTMNNIVRAESRRIGGLKLDEAIINHIRRKYNITVGQPTAESAKIQVGAAVYLQDEMTMEVQGRDNVTGLPRTIMVGTSEIVEALQDPLKQISETVRVALSTTPPELASDIMDRGIVLTGGTALLRGLDVFLTRETGVPVYRAENALIAAAVGAGRALSDEAILRRVAAL